MCKIHCPEINLKSLRIIVLLHRFNYATPFRAYTVEHSKHCSSAIYRRWTPFLTLVSEQTPNELGNYSRNAR